MHTYNVFKSVMLQCSVGKETLHTKETWGGTDGKENATVHGTVDIIRPQLGY